jgi:membrane-bound metal-dependent hydrolase YbcI (DUF457 family)
LLLAGLALVFDALNRHVEFGLLSTGPLDEVAHLATAALGLTVLACLADAPRRFYVAALVASVAIDLDHIPLYLGLLGDDGQRPVTHSLATVVAVAIAAAVSRRHRAVLAGVATGLVLHFARDIAEGPPGVRMLWPLDGRTWTASYWWFLGMIAVFTAARLILVGVSVPAPVFACSSNNLRAAQIRAPRSATSIRAIRGRIVSRGHPIARVTAGRGDPARRRSGPPATRGWPTGPGRTAPDHRAVIRAGSCRIRE